MRQITEDNRDGACTKALHFQSVKSSCTICLAEIHCSHVCIVCCFTCDGQRGAFVSEPAILVKRKAKGSQVWTMEKFENKIIDMRDLYEERKEKGLPLQVPDENERPAVIVFKDGVRVQACFTYHLLYHLPVYYFMLLFTRYKLAVHMVHTCDFKELNEKPLRQFK